MVGDFSARSRKRISGPRTCSTGAAGRRKSCAGRGHGTARTCRGKPLTGSMRCIKHAGPRAARAFRERQRKAYLSGNLSHEDWTRAEAKRAANRLRDQWKKNPWLEGRTIDLGEHEQAFSASVRLHRVKLDDLPPAVVDWLRWKFRRFQVDRSDDSKWADVLQVQLPERLRKIGPGPRTRTGETRGMDPDQLPGATAPGPAFASRPPRPAIGRRSAACRTSPRRRPRRGSASSLGRGALERPRAWMSRNRPRSRC